MKILLLGHNGQVGWELQRSLVSLGAIHAMARPEFDLGKFDDVRRLIREIQPEVIVNAVAFTAVDKAESEPELAYQINAQAVGVLAEESLRLNALLVHYSTDYVFDGTGTRPWVESDATGPVNVYGHSKCAGEQLLRQSGCAHLLLRTSGVYATRGNNFVRTVLRLAMERAALPMVDDQCGTPTHAGYLADITALAIKRIVADQESRAALCGTYHMTHRGEVTKYGLARFVVEEALACGARLALAPAGIAAITTAEYPLPARRPANSRLCVDKIERALDIQCLDWKAHCRDVVAMLVQGAHA